MKLFRYTCGDHEHFSAAEDEKDAYDRREEVNAEFYYLPVVVEELRIDGYEITLTPSSGDVVTMKKDQLKRWLKDRNIEFTPQLGEEKLREIALSHA